MDDRTKRLVKRLADHDGDVMHLTRTERSELLSLLPTRVVAEATMTPLPTKLGARALLDLRMPDGRYQSVDAVLMVDPSQSNAPEWYSVQGADVCVRSYIIGWTEARP